MTLICIEAHFDKMGTELATWVVISMSAYIGRRISNYHINEHGHDGPCEHKEKNIENYRTLSLMFFIPCDSETALKIISQH